MDLRHLARYKVIQLTNDRQNDSFITAYLGGMLGPVDQSLELNASNGHSQTRYAFK